MKDEPAAHSSQKPPAGLWIVARATTIPQDTYIAEEHRHSSLLEHREVDRSGGEMRRRGTWR